MALVTPPYGTAGIRCQKYIMPPLLCSDRSWHPLHPLHPTACRLSILHVATAIPSWPLDFVTCRTGSVQYQYFASPNSRPFHCFESPPGQQAQTRLLSPQRLIFQVPSTCLTSPFRFWYQPSLSSSLVLCAYCLALYSGRLRQAQTQQEEEASRPLVPKATGHATTGNPNLNCKRAA